MQTGPVVKAPPRALPPQRFSAMTPFLPVVPGLYHTAIHYHELVFRLGFVKETRRSCLAGLSSNRAARLPAYIDHGTDSVGREIVNLACIESTKLDTGS